MNMLQRKDLDERLAWAEEIVRAAGKVMQDTASSGNLGVRTKLDRTVVTDADKQINDMLIARVAEDFPEDGVLGEEASANEDRELLWVFDPIDDTKGYIYGMTTAMSSLALVENGVPVAAAMYEPQLDKLFTAVKGGGAFENGQPIHVSAQETLQGAQVAFGMSFEQVFERQKFYESVMQAGAKAIAMNGEAFKGSVTANGLIDAHVWPGRGAHDVAAVKLIVEEAGGKVTNLRGEDQSYARPVYGVIVSNGRFHDELVALMKQYDPENFIGY
jgi:fructose-1,6-bisphosphatase/inositol monophosphatase family enzyme